MTSSSPRAEVHQDLAGLTELGRSLPLEEKVRLLTGESVWKLHGIPSVGLRAIAVSDGPAGVRGLGETPNATSALFPAPSSVGATWDPELAAAIGRAFAQEARERGVDVVLAPQVNIQRTPVGGRHFECYSEDPHLTSMIGTAIIQGLQSEGVAACIKHFIANDSETDRTKYVSRVSPQALREVYLAPFEYAVDHGGVWSAMAAYNQVDYGTETAHMTEHHSLVVDLLKNELGFDGVVFSDWMATNATVGAALGGLDVVMPGPGGPWEEHLLEAVRAGDVPESVIDDKVGRILLLGSRVGALGIDPEFIDRVDVASLITHAAAQGTVVLARDEQNPVWDRAEPSTIALIGPNAVTLHVLGGGSSTVRPAHVVSPEEGLRARFPAADVRVARGGDARRLAAELDLSARAIDPASLISATFQDAEGATIATRALTTWDGWLWDIPDNADRVRLIADVRLDEPGEHLLSVGTVGGHRVLIDGQLASEAWVPVGVEVVLDSTINNPEGVELSVHVAEPRTVCIDSTHLVVRAGGYGAVVRAAYRHRLPNATPDEEIAEAVSIAAASDLTVVIVGTNEEVESEGWDRASLRLPGRQDDLVEAVLDVDPNAVIIVNAGAPVILPWLDRAGTVLWCWFPGQEAGHSLAAIIAGDLEPAGRLPWTLPAREQDVPVPHALPDSDGVVDYVEGVHVGYRAWERDAREPARPFGFGLGWTSWSHDELGAPRWNETGDLEVDVTISNTGERAGRETVQAYLEPPTPSADSPDRPVRWLAGFAAAEVAAGHSQQVTVVIPRRRFEIWDTETSSWVTPAGTYQLSVGRSVRQLHLNTAVHFRPGRTGVPTQYEGEMQ